MSKRTLLLLIAAVIAGFTALSVKSRLSQAPVAEAPVQNPRVIIAKHDLSPGSFIQASQDLDWGQPPTIPAAPKAPNGGESADNNATDKPDNAAQTVPQENYLYEARVKITDFNGAVVRRQVRGGDPVPADALMKAGAGGLLSAVLNPGMRAVSISGGQNNNNNGAPFVSGFVLPGDYVDLIVTREVTRQINNGREQESRKIVFSKIFVQNVRVLAVDQSLDNPENKAIVAKTVTVEVTPTQAQEIAVAAELGKVSVSLRSAVKQGSAEEKAEAETLANSNISDADIAGHDKTPDVSEQVRLFRPKETQNLEFYRTGR